MDFKVFIFLLTSPFHFDKNTVLSKKPNPPREGEVFCSQTPKLSRQSSQETNERSDRFLSKMRHWRWGLETALPFREGGKDSLFFGGGVALRCPAKELTLLVYPAVLASQRNFKCC